MPVSRNIRIGVPRGIFFYLFFDLAAQFFHELGAELVPSPETTGAIFGDGLRYCCDDACIPIKSFHGHTAYLADKADLILVPRIISISRREYVCPKIAALPDMIRSMPVKLPGLIDTGFNMYKRRFGLHKAFYDMAVAAGFERNAAFRAVNHLSRYISGNTVLTSPEASDSVPVDGNDCAVGVSSGSDRPKIGVVGHVYTLKDAFHNMNLMSKLSRNGLEPVAMRQHPLCVHDKDFKACAEAGHISQKRIFWYFGTAAVEAVRTFLGVDRAEGIIYVMSFGCGIDSFVSFIVERYLKTLGRIPFMTLVLDEHSGDAGLDTRIEAFADLVAHNRRYNGGGRPWY